MSKYFFKCTLNFKGNSAAELMKVNYLKKDLLLSGGHSSKVFVKKDGESEDKMLCISLTGGDPGRVKPVRKGVQCIKVLF